MRLLAIGILAALGAGAMTVALADPPANAPAPADKPAATTTATTAASTPASPPAKSTSLKDEFTPEENHFVQEGYHLEIHRGERVFCRYEVNSGSRIERQKICGTVDALKSSEAQSQRAFGAGQTQQSSH